MLQTDPDALLYCRWWQQLSRREIMLHLLEEPWVTDGRTSNHNAIYSVFITIFQSLLRGIDIPITKNWNFDTRIILHLGNQRPIGLALVHLHSGAPVNRQGLDAYILQALCYFFYIF